MATFMSMPPVDVCMFVCLLTEDFLEHFSKGSGL